VIDKKYASPEFKQEEAKRLGLECVPSLYYNEDVNCDPIQKCSELIKNIEEENLISLLGGIPEGIVLKHHSFNKNGKIVATKKKMVTNKFKERHCNKQEKMTYSVDDYIKRLGLQFATEARYHKAFQHLIEKGDLDRNHLKNDDVHKMTIELNSDFDKEYKEEVMMCLWTELSSIIKKHAREGLRTWYTNNILQNQ
jgi:hypothetical protein